MPIFFIALKFPKLAKQLFYFKAIDSQLKIDAFEVKIVTRCQKLVPRRQK